MLRLEETWKHGNVDRIRLHWSATFQQKENTYDMMAEIRRSPVEVGALSRYLRGFTHPMVVTA